jgi:hypothetical protein
MNGARRMQKINSYIVVESSFGGAFPEKVSYFHTICSKTFPDLSFKVCYTDNIPIDGNFYICYQNSISALYKELVSNGKLKPKDLLKDFVIIESQALYVASFNYDIDMIADNVEVKRAVFSYFRNEVMPKKDLILSLIGNTEEVLEEEKEVVVIKEVSAPVVVIPEKTREEKIEEFEILIDEIINTMIDNSTKINDRSLSDFDNIRIYSSSSPEHFITLASSAKSNYPNKMLVSELFIIIKASKLVGADSIKFNIRKGM